MNDEFEEPATITVRFPDGERQVPYYINLEERNPMLQKTPSPMHGYRFYQTFTYWVAIRIYE